MPHAHWPGPSSRPDTSWCQTLKEKCHAFVTEVWSRARRLVVLDLDDRPRGFEHLEALVATAGDGRRGEVDHPVLHLRLERGAVEMIEKAPVVRWTSGVPII